MSPAPVYRRVQGRAAWWTCLLMVMLTASCSKDNPSVPTPVTHSPVVVRVTFPSQIPATAGRTNGSVSFTDSGRDVNHVYFTVASTVGSTFTPFDFDPGVSGQSSGTFSFNAGCNGPSNCSGTTTLNVYLTDAQGNASGAVQFSFTYQ